MDLDSWALLHAAGHQAGVAVGYTRLGLTPCHRPLLAGLAAVKRATEAPGLAVQEVELEHRGGG